MKIKAFAPYLWKLALCSVVYYTGRIANVVILFGLGLRTRTVSARLDFATNGLGILAGSLCLAFIARRLRTNWLVRWMILAELTWLCGGAVLAVQSFILTSASFAYSLVHFLFALFGFLIPSVLFSGAVSVLFPRGQPFTVRQNAFGKTFLKPRRWHVARTEA